MANPYRMEVNNLPAGAYILAAVLTDKVGNTSTSSVDIIVNELPNISITSPADGAGLIAPASFVLQAEASDVDGTVTQVQFLRGSTTLRTLAEPPYAVSINKLPAGNYRFEAVATDNLGSVRSTTIDVIVKQPPTVTITSPAAGARLTMLTNMLTGTANDSERVSSVEVSVNGGAFTPANGNNNWNNWSTTLVLPAGTNLLRVRATDRFGNYSPTNIRSVFQVVSGPLSLAIEGEGTVSGATNGQFMEVGRSYRLLATPAEGHVFSNWTGTISSNTPALNFLMQSNMSLQAHFVPNPFLRVNGTYNGLFFQTSSAQHESSGDFRLRVTSTGNYKATLRLAGRRYAAKGKLDLEGKATNVITRAEMSPLTIEWNVDLQGLDQVKGIITDGAWLSELYGDRAVFNSVTNPAPLYGRYTFVLPGSSSPESPNAQGWGTLNITTSGSGIASGSLPDGTRFRYKAPISKTGAWPLYAPLYLAKGSLIGWLQFNTNAPLDDVSGWMTWVRPTQPGAPYYSAGFTNVSLFSGSRYVAPANSAEPVLAMTEGMLLLNGGGLSQSWTNDFILESNSQISNASSQTFGVSISLSSGLFQGTFFDPGVNRTVRFSGALLQKSNRGAGYFLGTYQAGSVHLERRP